MDGDVRNMLDEMEAVEAQADEPVLQKTEHSEDESVAEKKDVNQTEESSDWTEESARKALEELREAENRAYHGMSRAVLTKRQKGILQLAALEKADEEPTQEILDQKCRLLLESYVLPRALKEGVTVKLDKAFTRGEDASKDYIEAVFTNASGKTRNVGYNYKTEEDGRNLILFEKVFETVVLKPGEPEKYVLYEPDNTTERMSYSKEELDKKVLRDEIVKIEDVYFRKATNADGEVKKGETTMIVEDEGLSNTKIIIGNNEQYKYSISKNGQLVCATTNDVTTVTVETRTISSQGPVYNSAEAAMAAASKEVQNGETNLKVDVSMEGTTVAQFKFLPVYTTSIELTGLVKKIGKGVEGYDVNESDEENLRRMLAKPINQYLDEKGFQVLDIVCENIRADVSENVGWINTMKTYQMTGGVVVVTYIKRNSAVVSLKQGFLGRTQGVDENAVLAQLPEGSELLNPQDIDWKNPKPTVTYVMRGHVTGIGSARTISDADEAAAQNAIQEAQKITVKGLNGGIASGIREAIGAQGGVSTVANVRARMENAVISQNDMELSHREPKYAFTATCDRMVTAVENKLVSVTSWNGDKLVHIPAKEPVVDKGIPTDENYERYVNEGDDLGILLFEKSDKGLRRYMDEVQRAQIQAGMSVNLFQKARTRLHNMQEIFDKLFDEKLEQLAKEAEETEFEEDIANIGIENIEPEGTDFKEADAYENDGEDREEEENGKTLFEISINRPEENKSEKEGDEDVSEETLSSVTAATEAMTSPVLGGAGTGAMTSPVLGGAGMGAMTSPVLGGAGMGAMTNPVLGGAGMGAMTSPVLGGAGTGAMTNPVLGGAGTGAMTNPVLGGAGMGAMTSPVLGGAGMGAMTSPVLGGAGTGAMTNPVLGGAGTGAMTNPVLGGAGTGAMTSPVLGGAGIESAKGSEQKVQSQADVDEAFAKLLNGDI